MFFYTKLKGNSFKMTYTYKFITEIDTADIKELKRVLKNKAKIRKTNKLLNPFYSEEFQCICGEPIYQMKSDLDLNTLKQLINTGRDLHYVYRSIQLCVK